MSEEKKILYPTALSPEQLAKSTTPDFLFWCPGCQEAHGVWTTRRNTCNAIWSFDGNMEKPTFNPSLLLRYTKTPTVDPVTQDWTRGPDGKYLTKPDGKLFGAIDVVCHSFIRAGQIQFLPDCTHALSGKTVPMEVF